MAKRQNAKHDVKKKLVSRPRPLPFLSTPPFLFTIEKLLKFFFKSLFGSVKKSLSKTCLYNSSLNQYKWHLLNAIQLYACDTN